MADDTMKILQWPEQVAKLCVTVCEPICAQSSYTIAIDVFDKPVASITVSGNTKFYACPDANKPPVLK